MIRMIAADLSGKIILRKQGCHHLQSAVRRFISGCHLMPAACQHPHSKQKHRQ